MSDKEIRLECLKAALSTRVPIEELIATAEKFWAFVANESVAPLPPDDD